MTRFFQYSNLLITLIISTLISNSFNAFCEEELKPSQARLTPAVRAVKKALPWVVNIGTRQEIIQINDPFNMFFTEFFGRARGVTKTMQYSPLGSGVFIDAHGLILTNSHVVRRAPQIEVRLWDGSSYPAKVVGYDMPNDLCLLQLQGDFDASLLTEADFARCNDLLLGESVIAIGNPFGLEHSVSQGVLSAFNRSFTEDDVSFDDILQTDAAINPGNSGGPLVNLDGQLIGINLAIRADAQGICFAIPLARIEQFLSYWMKPSHFTSGFIGLPPNAVLQRAPNGGVVLPEIVDESPLAKAGLHEGDVIATIDGRSVTRPIEMSRMLWQLKADQKVIFTTDKGQNYNVIVANVPQELLFETRLGLKLQSLTPQVRHAMGVPDEVEGLMVSEVLAESFFAIQNARWRQILKRGDIIVQFNDRKIDSAETLATQLSQTHSGDFCQLGVYSIAPDRRKYIPVLFEALYLH